MAQPEMDQGVPATAPANQAARRQEAKVPCPKCGHLYSRVVDTVAGTAPEPKRRRECAACHARYNTREVLDAA